MGPVPWMLEAAIVLETALSKYIEAAIIVALLVFNAALGFFQEGRAQATLAALKSRLAPERLGPSRRWEEHSWGLPPKPASSAPYGCDPSKPKPKGKAWTFTLPASGGKNERRRQHRLPRAAAARNCLF